MSQISLILRSRPVFVLLYCVFILFLATNVVSVFSTDFRISVPGLAFAIVPTAAVGAVFASYWFYMTQMTDAQMPIRLEWPTFSLKLTIFLTTACGSAAVVVVLLGNFHTSPAGIMVSLIYGIGLVAVLISSAIRPHLGICAMILTLPFAFLLHINLRSTTDTNSFGYIVINPEIVLIFATATAVFTGLLLKNKGPVFTKIDIAMAIFLGGSLIALLVSPDISHSSKVLLTGTWIPVLAYYSLVNGIRTRREFLHVLSSLLFSFLIIGGYSLLTFQRLISVEGLAGGEQRLAQLVLNPGVFAVLLTLILPLLIALAVSSAVPPKFRLALTLISVILLVELISTQTRGAWVGFAVSVLVLLTYGEARRALLKAIPVITAASLFGWGFFSRMLADRTGSPSEIIQSASATERFETWRSAWQMIIHNPVFGVGPGMFRDTYYQYQVGFVASFADLGTNAHSLLLNIWAETGTAAIIGFSGLVFFTLLGGYNLFRSSLIPLEKSIALGLFAGLIGFLVSASLFGALLASFTSGKLFFSSGNTIYLFMVLALTVVLTRMKNHPQDDMSTAESKRLESSLDPIR